MPLTSESKTFGNVPRLSAVRIRLVGKRTSANPPSHQTSSSHLSISQSQPLSSPWIYNINFCPCSTLFPLSNPSRNPHNREFRSCPLLCLTQKHNSIHTPATTIVHNPATILWQINPLFTMSKQFTAAEVAEHKTDNSLYIIIDSSVYDLTSFIGQHPGGPRIIRRVAGKDATKQFWKVNSPQIPPLQSHSLTESTSTTTTVFSRNLAQS
jgi:cytochrome b involved in lipid metabolism